jgi:capsid protein
VFDSLRKIIAKAIAPTERAPAAAQNSASQAAPNAVRMYQASRASRLTGAWANSTTSADSELVSSLQTLRNRSRALVRDAAYAKRAKVIVQNNVIGSGIGMQAQVMSSARHAARGRQRLRSRKRSPNGRAPSTATPAARSASPTSSAR